MSESSPFDVFHRLVRQALGDAGPYDETLDLQVFRAAGVPGAAVVKFFPEELAESLHVVYVPAGMDADGSLMERLHAAVDTHADLLPVEDAVEQRTILVEVRGLLERYLASPGPGLDEAVEDVLDEGDDADLDGHEDPEADDEAGDGWRRDRTGDEGDPDGAGESPPARLEFGPLEALQALGAARGGTAVSSLAREGDDEPDEGLDDGVEAPIPDDRPTFRALALDVLSGVPQPHGSAHDLPDSYEVWGFRGDPVATVVLRFFDGGRTALLGALAPGGEAFDAGRFFAAAYRLLATKLPGAVTGPLDGRLSDLEPLGTGAALERLCRARGHEQVADVRELTTALIGEPTPEIEDAAEDLRLLDPRAPESPDALFAAIAGDVVERGAEVLWTKKKEREGEARIEVLEHREHPGALLLIDFGGPDRPTDAVAYVPGEPAAFEAFETAVAAMLDARTAYDEPTPLDERGPFRRVPNPQAVFAVERALEALEDGEGGALAFRDPRDG